jgi:S1-C subfamily serine protease
MPVCLPLAISLVRKIQMKDDLVLVSTRGGAGVGRYGVRQGDVVTHVGDVPVSNREELERALTSAAVASQDDRDSETVTLTVNASQATARTLQERASQMQGDNVRFL